MKPILALVAAAMLIPVAGVGTAPATAQDWIGRRLDTDQFERLRKHNVERARQRNRACASKSRVYGRKERRYVTRTVRARCHR